MRTSRWFGVVRTGAAAFDPGRAGPGRPGFVGESSGERVQTWCVVMVFDDLMDEQCEKHATVTNTLLLMSEVEPGYLG